MRGPASRLPHHLLASSLLVLGCGAGPRQVARGDNGARSCGGGAIFHQDEAIRLRGCEQIKGDLVLGGALLSAEDLKSLRFISGSLTIGPSYQLNNLAALRGLERVGGNLEIKENWELSGIFLNGLTHVGTTVWVRDNPGLVSLVLPRLRVAQVLQVGGNRRLTRVDLSDLGPVDETSFVRGKSLKAVEGAVGIDWQKKLQKRAAPNTL